MKRENIFTEINLEKKHQIKKHGLGADQLVYFVDPDLKRTKGTFPSAMNILLEIPTESRAREICDLAFIKKELTFGHIVSEELSEAVQAWPDLRKQRKEVIQVAASAVAWIEAIDKKLLEDEGK